MFQIIPAIDIIGGKCVRLIKGDYNRKTIYSDDPVAMAQMFESWGISRLHLVDLDGAREKRVVNINVLRRIAFSTHLTIDFGGGLRSEDDVRMVLDNGASMITGGSIAVNNPRQFLQWLDAFGSDKIILGADHKNGKISLNAWADESDSGLFAFIGEFIQNGVKKVICTDIQKDGMLEGPSLDIYKEIHSKWPGIELIASGGVSNMEDIILLEKAGMQAAIVGKALYENRITKEEIINFLNNS